MARTHASIYMPRVRELKEYPERLAEIYKVYIDTIGLNNDCPWVSMYMHRPEFGVTDCPVCLQNRPRAFAEIVNRAAVGKDCESVIDEDNPVVICEKCKRPDWNEDTHTDVEGNTVCDTCRQHYTACYSCHDWSMLAHFLTYVDGYHYCESCRDNECSHCDDCDMWYFDRNAEDHEHNNYPDCECMPHDLHFEILANSHGVMHQDERLLIELPEGHITDQAITAAIQAIWTEQFSQLHDKWINDAYLANTSTYDTPKPEGYVEYNDITRVIGSLERVWQAKRGNFTRRLSAALYKELGVKLNEGLLSKVGATVRSHTTMRNSWHIEFTRNLNQSAQAFFHEDSCWWGSESSSLCALKHWGGFAMRAYGSEDQERSLPSGRAWVQPFNEDLEPTLDIHGAHAYVVYNGYGDLDGYTPARLLAYLTSKTYKKIDFDASYQYVNSGGYLIANEETCENTSEISIDRNYHEAVSA